MGSHGYARVFVLAKAIRVGAGCIVCGHAETKEGGTEGEGEGGRGWQRVAVGPQEGCGRRAIVGVAPRLP